jgi:gluconate kinase
MAKDVKAALKAHMMKKDAHPDPAAKKLKKGGPTTDDRKKYGKNMAKVMSQKTG